MKKWFIGLGLLLVSLLAFAILTNPSYNRFKEFAVESDELGTKKFVLRKVNNYLLYSVYEKERYDITNFRHWEEKTTYYGYLLNFHPKETRKAQGVGVENRLTIEGDTTVLTGDTTVYE